MTRFPETAARQSGLLAGVGELSVEALSGLVEGLCRGGCLREPLWAPGATGRAEPMPAEDLAVPCREACSVLLSAAAERAPPTTRGAEPVLAPRS